MMSITSHRKLKITPMRIALHVYFLSSFENTQQHTFNNYTFLRIAISRAFLLFKKQKTKKKLFIKNANVRHYEICNIKNNICNVKITNTTKFGMARK